MSNIHNKVELNTRRKELRKRQTKPELILWNCVRNNQINNCKFKRQHSINWYIADFYCAEKRLVIELDGDSHFTEKGREYDLERTKLFNALNINVIRFTNTEIFENMEQVIDKIKSSTSPALSLQRRGV